MNIRTALAALLAPLFLVTACGGSTSVADPPVSPPPTSSSAPPPPKSESPEHFIRRWAEVEKRMENTGKTSAYLALSQRCAACRRLAAQIRSIYASGGYVRWGGWDILNMKLNASKGRARTYAVRNRSLPTTYRESAQGPTHQLHGGVTTELLQIEATGSTWRLVSKAELAS